MPFFLCTSLALFLAFTDTNPNATFGRQGIYDYLSGTWLIVGIILSALTLFILLTYDAFEYWERAAKKRRLSK